jgi:Uma2 family endonuclease
MTALLEMPEVRQRMHRMSVEEYHRAGEIGAFGKNVELLRGIVITKMSKSPLHELVSQKLMNILWAQVPAGFEVRREGPLTLSDSEPEPDLSVVRGSPDDWAKAHPATAHLVVEVAISSAAVDESKAEIYAQAGVPEYWLIRPEDRTVQIFRQPAPDGYRSQTSLTSRDTLHCESIPGIAFPISSILPA